MVADGQTTEGANLLLSIDPERQTVPVQKPSPDKLSSFQHHSHRTLVGHGATLGSFDRVQSRSELAQHPQPQIGQPIRTFDAYGPTIRNQKAQMRTPHWPFEAVQPFQAQQRRNRSPRPSAHDGWPLSRNHRFLRPSWSDTSAQAPPLVRFGMPMGVRTKVNEVTRASQILRKSGEQCAGIDDDRGPNHSIWQEITERKKTGKGRLRPISGFLNIQTTAWRMMDTSWHRMASRATAEGGSALVQTSQAIPRRRSGSRRVLALAWTAYLRGDPKAAIDWAELMIWKLPVEVSPMH